MVARAIMGGRHSMSKVVTMHPSIRAGMAGHGIALRSTYTMATVRHRHPWRAMIGGLARSTTG